jgi:hypothetical protein
MLRMKMPAMKTVWKQWKRPLLPSGKAGLALVSAVALAGAFLLSACENVATYTEPSLVRVIDASYNAPAVNVNVENVTLAANVGQGSISAYGTLAANEAAAIKVTEAADNTTLVSTTGTLLAGKHHSVLLTDNGASSTGYIVNVLEDQQTAASGGHSAFRFINQASKTGPVDIYIIPAGSTIANTIPLLTGVAVGQVTGYTSFASQTVTMVITATGSTTAKYTSSQYGLTGGEVRTVLLVNTQLTSNPAIVGYVADDVN